MSRCLRVNVNNLDAAPMPLNPSIYQTYGRYAMSKERVKKYWKTHQFAIIGAVIALVIIYDQLFN